MIQNRFGLADQPTNPQITSGAVGLYVVDWSSMAV